MKHFIILFGISIISNFLMARISLKECIESGLENKANIKSAKTELLVSNLKRIETKAKYLPQISLAYDARYNPVIPSQIVPVGKFSPTPTNESRAIQFGTNWQQNAGLSVYQPMVDLAVRSRIKEGKLNEALSEIDLKKAEDDLKFEIVKAYSRVLVFSYEVTESIADTVRSFESLAIINAKFKQGLILKTDLNNAQINHNTNLSNYKRAIALLINEKVFLHFLTNISLKRILDESFNELPENIFELNKAETEIQYDSIPEFQQLLLKRKLVNQQIRTEKSKYTPTIGFQGFLGANQFSQSFNPVLNNSWFGNSYVGLAVKLPLFSPDRSINAGKQLQAQIIIIENKTNELKADKKKALLQTNIEIERLKVEINVAQYNILLVEENINIYQERLKNGQFAATEVNVQEAEVQKKSIQLKQLKAQLNEMLVEQLYISGQLSNKLKFI